MAQIWERCVLATNTECGFFDDFVLAANTVRGGLMDSGMGGLMGFVVRRRLAMAELVHGRPGNA